MSPFSAILEHPRPYPFDKPIKERESLRVKALLGRVTEAHRAGTAFHFRFPRSALVDRIDEILGPRK